jgi:hypothetical protein
MAQIEAQRELRELQIDQERFQNRSAKPKRKKRASLSEQEEDSSSESSSKSSLESSDFELPIQPLCVDCTEKTLMQERRTNEGNKLFFSCPDCNSFQWAKDAYENQPSGPPCHCGHPSYPQILEREGEEDTYCRVWCCVNTDGTKGCDFELLIADTWHERSEQVHTAPGRLARPRQSDSDEQHHVGAHTKKLLQGLIRIENSDSPYVQTVGRNGYVDYYQVHRAWRVDVPQSAVDEFKELRNAQRSCGMHTELRPTHQQAME